jgi:hypothetical protein
MDLADDATQIARQVDPQLEGIDSSEEPAETRLLPGRSCGHALEAGRLQFEV